MKVKVKVFGVGSLEVENYDASALLSYISHKLKELEGVTVKDVKRGAPKKIKPTIPEGTAAPQ